MKQKQYRSIADLINQGGVLVGAATELGATLGLHHNDKDAIQFDLSNLITSVNVYEGSKEELATRRGTLKDVAHEVTLHLRKSRDNLKPILGYTYSNDWMLLGYNDTMRSPTRPQDQAAFLEALRAYYASHAANEVPTLNLTAAATGTLLTTLTTAQTAVAAQLGTVQSAKVVRDEKRKLMSARVTALRKELSHLMGPTDPRWLNFGFGIPATVQKPEQVTGVVVTILGPSVAAMKWDKSSRASHYRVWKQVIGVDEEPVAVGSPGDIDFNLEGLPQAATVDIYVSAVNEAGEGPKSAKVTIVTHV